MTDPHARLAALADQLQVEGAMPSAWRETFLRVPRHVFVPAKVWVRDSDGDYVPVSYDEAPQEWWECVYRDAPVITQMDDGRTPTGTVGSVPTSSASMPTMVVEMLDHLDAHHGHRVLEIGTGTGYNAALLSARVGEDNVTSIDVDADVAGQAAKALNAAGWHPTVVTGDGEYGYPPSSPYDRVIATCAVQRIPYSWVRQTRPGGVIVTPWETAYGEGALLRLVVDGNGAATGRVVGDSAFMWLRAQRVPHARWHPREALQAGEVEQSTTTLHLDAVFHSRAADFLLGAAVPDCQVRVCDAEDGSGEFTVWLYDPRTRSGAAVDYAPDADTYDVGQCGPRRLWDEIEDTYRRWVDLGKPERERFGMTVTPERQYVWLDDSGGPSWELPGLGSYW